MTPDTRIPLRNRATVRSADRCYIVDGLLLKFKYALAYLAHDQQNPQHMLTLFELYPRPDVRDEAFVQRLDNGSILIYNPFWAVFGRTDGQLVEFFRKELAAELPETAGATPEWMTDNKGCHYLVLDSGVRGEVSHTDEIPTADPLASIPSDELVSYLILHQYPLFQYREENGDISMLCLGSGVFMQRMILSILACGQLPKTKLHLHIMSDTSQDEFMASMLEKAPLLAEYLTLNGEDGKSVAVHYRQVPNLLAPNALTDLPDARYMLVSLGNPANNSRAVEALVRQLQADPTRRNADSIIHYHCPASTTRKPRISIPAWLKAVPFSEDLRGYEEALQELAQLTVRLAHMYNKLQNPKTSLKETADGLTADGYGQKSSCCSALHLKYKLASVGIDPNLPMTEIIPAYQKALKDPTLYGRLISNEHFRWLYYMIGDHFRLPTEEQLMQYGFEYLGNSFNGSWKNKKARLHHCLVPCDDAGIRLTPQDFQTYGTRESIENAPFDPLDKTSLMLHLLAGEKCEAILKNKLLAEDFKAISCKLPADANEETDMLRNRLEEAERLVTSKAGAFQYTGHQVLEELLQAFGAEGVDISAEIAHLKNRLSVFLEYNRRVDYKRADETIVTMLPWVLYGEDLKLIMLSNQTVAASIAAPLLMDPAELVFLGKDPQPMWTAFFENHGLRAPVRFIPAAEADALEEILRREISQAPCKCIIDLTDATSAAAIAAYRLCLENEQVGLIRSTEDGRIENVRNFPQAAAYSLKVRITAEDVFNLHGAHKIQAENQYMDTLCDLMPTLWKMYQTYQNQWHMISGFFSSPKSKPTELYIGGLVINDATQWEWHQYAVDEKIFRRTHLESHLQELQEKGIIRGLKVDYVSQKKKGSVAQIQFHFPQFPHYAASILDRFFNQTLPKSNGVYTCEIQERNGKLAFEFSNGRKLYMEDYSTTFNDSHGSPHPYAELLPILKYMQNHKLLHELSTQVDNRSAKISFSYAHPQLRDCLSKAGNMLEFFIYNEARKTGCFDDIQPNFTFAWKEEDVSNELDLILTAGFKNLFVSAKSGTWKKEQLYEIKYLTDRFSVNSIPVIVYSSSKAFEDTPLVIKQRANAMGVHLIDLNDLDCSLGEKLVQIVRGK